MHVAPLFERNTEPLAERFRVVSVDLRGHGESPASAGGHTVAQYAQDVKHLLDTLGLEDAVLVGWSMWGADEKVAAAANGPWLQATQPSAELVVFEESGHCPMWEEPARFNQVVGDWIEALPAGS